MADEDEARAELFRAEVEKLTEDQRVQKLEDTCRRIGLYAEGSQIVPVETPFGVKPGLAVAFTVGRVAFTRRVQEPVAAQIDRELREMDAANVSSEYDSISDRIKRNVAAGRDPFDDGDVDPDRA